MTNNKPTRLTFEATCEMLDRMTVTTRERIGCMEYVSGVFDSAADKPGASLCIDLITGEAVHVH